VRRLAFLNRPKRRTWDGAWCLCTLAIDEPYRRRARQLCSDAAPWPVVILTDKPRDFAGLGVRAVAHSPTGPMAADFRRLQIETGTGAAAYHDKRFALQTALEDFETAIFVDADSRLGRLPALDSFSPGLAMRPLTPETVDEHLLLYGPQRRPLFERLAVELFGSAEPLTSARWIVEDCFAVTRDGREPDFFDAWERGATLFQGERVFSGEGGVIGLAAAYAGWSVDYEALAGLAKAIEHESGGPKVA
jgi:hypothetical protein